MTREECYGFIKSHDLKDKANKLAKSLYGCGANYTNLTTATLNNFVEKAGGETKPTTTIKDEGARRAIIALARAIGLKGIEKNF